MPRFFVLIACALVFGVALVPLAAVAGASPVPSPAATETASMNKDAGTIEGEVTQVAVTPGKSMMVVKSGGQSITFAVLAGTSVKGPTGDFAVDVKVGSHVSVSASKSGASYTAQIVRVLPSVPAHAAH